MYNTLASLLQPVPVVVVGVLPSVKFSGETPCLPRVATKWTLNAARVRTASHAWHEALDVFSSHVALPVKQGLTSLPVGNNFVSPATYSTESGERATRETRVSTT